MREPTLAMRAHNLVDRADALLWRFRRGLETRLHRWSFRVWVLFSRECPAHPSVRLARNVSCFPCAAERRQQRSTLRRGAGA